MAKRPKQDKSKKVRDQLTDLSSNSSIAGLMIVGTLVLAGSIVASKVLVSEIGFNNRVLSEKRQVNSVLESNVNNLDPLKTNFEAMSADGVSASDVLTALPTEHDFHNLSGQLELLASFSGTQLLTVALSGGSIPSDGAAGTPAAEAAPVDSDSTATADQVVDEAQVEPATFTISANGSYKSLQTFIAATELFVRPIQVNAVKFSGSEPAVVLELTITTYYQPRLEVSNETRTIQ